MHIYSILGADRHLLKPASLNVVRRKVDAAASIKIKRITYQSNFLFSVDTRSHFYNQTEENKFVWL